MATGEAACDCGQLRIEVDGVALHVDVDGPDDAPPVVFLHGVSGSGATYDWLPGEITHGRRILRVDLRGHGRSAHAPGTYLIDRYGADVAEIVRRVAGRPAVLVGHSLGGVAAWWVAQRHPELVAAAFLEDPPLYMGEPAEHERNEIAKLFPLMRDQAAAWQRAGADVAAVAEEVAAAPFGPNPSLRTRDALHDDAIRSRAEAWLSMDPEVLTGAADRSTLAATDTTSPVTVPVLILAADDALGPAFPSAHERRLAATHPDVEVVRVPGAGHGIHAERAGRGAYVEHLAQFLRRRAR
jgi:pimeloyl-ACP methyl ester carboxylesterase